MAPWAGRIRGNAIGNRVMDASFGPWAIHGTAPWRRATVEQRDATSITFTQDLGEWPFAGSVTTSWRIEDQTISADIVVSSHLDAFPATVGWHPWFPRELDGVSAVVTLPATQQLLRGPDALPTGEVVAFHDAPGTFDDAFLVPEQRASITWPGVARVEVTSSSPWFVLFDQLPDAICIEPQSGPPDGLRSHSFWEPQLVTPDNPLELRTQWRVALL